MANGGDAMKKWLVYIAATLLLLIAIFFLGPKPPMDREIQFSKSELGDDLDVYLSDVEAKVSNLAIGTGKEIVWADPLTKSKTPLAVIYVHGFSATKQEIRPVPDNVAKAFGANLYFTRLKGHGRDGPAMAEATANDWLNDFAETVAIGERLGERLVIISTSTGGTVVSVGTENPELMRNIAGMIFVSPNYVIHGGSTTLMTMPWAKQIMPLIAGGEIRWTPLNEEHDRWWTMRFPSTAFTTMGAMMKMAEQVDYSAIKLPALFVYSDKDQVVVPAATDKVVAAWGGPKEVVKLDSPESKTHHVITGDIVSPANTAPVSELFIKWIKALPR